MGGIIILLGSVGRHRLNCGLPLVSVQKIGQVARLVSHASTFAWAL